MKKKISDYLSPLVTMGTFTFIANLLLVLSFYFYKDLPNETFASINFGIYILSMFGILNESLSKALTVNLSEKDPSKYKKYLFSVFRSVTPIFFVIIALVTLVLYYIFPQYFILLILCGAIASIIYVYMYLRAWINALENYIILGTLLLGIPFARLISALLITDLNYLWIFIFILFAGVLMIGGSCLFLSKKDKSFSLKFVPNNHKRILISNLLSQILIQLGINIFWIADGIILKNLLSVETYNSYVTYAYIYKFPFFISASFVLVLLGNNVQTKSKRKLFTKNLLISLTYVAIGFIGVFLFDYFTNGLILKALGYEKHIVAGLTLYFGLAWLFQTLAYLLFNSLQKIMKEREELNVLIFSYATTYILIIFLLSSDINNLILGILGHGFLYFLIAAAKQFSLLKSPKS